MSVPCSNPPSGFPSNLGKTSQVVTMVSQALCGCYPLPSACNHPRPPRSPHPTPSSASGPSALSRTGQCGSTLGRLLYHTHSFTFTLLCSNAFSLKRSFQATGSKNLSPHSIPLWRFLLCQRLDHIICLFVYCLSDPLGNASSRAGSPAPRAPLGTQWLPS